MQLWSYFEEFRDITTELKDQLIKELNLEKLDQFLEGSEKFLKELEKNLPENFVLTNLKQNIEKYREISPFIKALRSEYLIERHVVEIRACLGNMMEGLDLDWVELKRLCPVEKEVSNSSSSVKITQENSKSNSLQNSKEKLPGLSQVISSQEESTRKSNQQKVNILPPHVV